MDGVRQASRGAGPAAPLREYLEALGIIALIALGCLLARSRVQPIDVALVLLLAVVLVAARFRQGPALLATVAAIALFDYGFVPPYYTFRVQEPSYLLTFGVMLAVALVMGRLTAQIRWQADEAMEREGRTAALYEMVLDLAEQETPEALSSTAARHIGRTAAGTARILLAPADEAPGQAQRWPERESFRSPAELGAALRAWQDREPAGRGTRVFPDAEALVAPILTPARALGIVLVTPAEPDAALPPSAERTVLALVSQLSLALERMLSRPGAAQSGRNR